MFTLADGINIRNRAVSFVQKGKKRGVALPDFYQRLHVMNGILIFLETNMNEFSRSWPLATSIYSPSFNDAKGYSKKIIKHLLTQVILGLKVSSCFSPLLPSTSAFENTRIRHHHLHYRCLVRFKVWLAMAVISLHQQ